MAKDLQAWIQENTESKVTEKFVQAIKNIAKLHNADCSKFERTCMALGKFRGKERFLKELFQYLTAQKIDSKRPASDEDDQADDAVPVPSPVQLNRARRKVLAFDFEDDNDSNDECVNAPNLGLSKSDDGVIPIKKIKKSTAQRLKVFSEKQGPKVTEKYQLIKKSAAVVPVLEAIPDLSQMRRKAVDQQVSEPRPEETDQIPIEESVAEDRDWYNSDEFDAFVAYPEEANEEPVNSKNFSQSIDNVEVGLRIRLTAIPLNERKDIIPPFLKVYENEDGERAIIGAMGGTQGPGSGIINPFRTPESEFSINARRGSKVVAELRKKSDRREQASQATKFTGTAAGNILGIKENSAPKSKKAVEDSMDEPREQNREEIKRVRESLPAYKCRSDLLQIIRDNQSVVVIGETGSGKTTQLGQYLYEEGFCKGGKMIGVTQPRRVAAMSVAKRVAVEMGVELGKEVGFAIRFEDKTSSLTRIKFMTDGILLRETMLDEMLDNYSCIIMDEAHERSLNTDVLFGIFKNLLSKRRDLKLIITSATMNANKFSQFFGDAPQFTIPGRTFPVQVNYAKYPVEDYVSAAVNQAVDIHLTTSSNSGDILIFMTGQEDINATCELLKESILNARIKRKEHTNINVLDDVEILPLYSSLPADIQGKIFKATQLDKRKIVIATNIAETSLTIDGIKYVIDSGYSKLKVYNPRIGLDSLAVTPISLANANQRSGRAGRTGPGIAYRLYTEDSALEDMYPQSIPEIQRTNLSNTMLLLKSLGVTDILKFSFLDSPPTEILMVSLFELWSLGAVDNFGNLTSLGNKMAKFPLQPSLSKILLMSVTHECSEEMVTIVSMLSVPQVFYRPKERENASDKARNRFLVAESDHLTLLNVYSQWKSNRYSVDWCTRHFLHYKSLKRAYDIRLQLVSIMEKERLSLVSIGQEWDVLRKCICAGYVNQAARLSGLAQYVHLRNGMNLKLHPTSALYGAGDLPPYVVYHELLLTSKEYIAVVTAVDPFWLMDYGNLFYSIKKISDREVYGLYDNELENKTYEEPDSLDQTINTYNRSRELMLEKLKEDTDKLKSRSLDNVQKRDTDCNPRLRIGFKKRRPF
ncbi:HEL231Cp [Eremothecium sinecaudum]|uniref:Pre-mRNA-splicing factor ATP-dependent RNA helicase PRP16 n=1 Tax=Eremothecium sinecaudum TaxID=45286 RepID=A0A0X8HTB5_9SACH|nr:HEL231Cp [Eremothecium sinecaudum]AMD21050.1 HEL231Cp [Eremothecium sinecaudum]